MVGVASDPLIRRSAGWAFILAWWMHAAATAQGPAFPQGGPMPGEAAPPNVAPAPGAPGGSSGYRPTTPERVVSPNASARRPGETLVADVVFEGLKSVRHGSLPKL